jgi:hypothetical protein
MTIQEAINAIANDVAEAIEALVKLIKDICDAIGEALRLWLVHEPKQKTTIGATMARFKAWVRKIFKRRIRRKYNALNERSDLYE